jgi:Ni/Fe-hydrogenase 1 B-type cytochrome subunit
MIDIVEKGSYRVAVHEPVDAEQLEPQQVLALCAAGARNGSGDPIDLALVHSATSRGQAIPFEQGSWSGPSPERRYSLVQLRRVIDDCELRVARGDLDSILALTVASDQRRERSHQALASLETEGFVGIGVAVAENTGGWRFAGIVPVRVTHARPSMKDSPADFRIIHVWDWQLRMLHWTWVILIAVLAVTGLMISEGWVPWYGGRENGFAFGWVRLIHYIAGWLLAAVLLLRAAGCFFGSNRYQRWSALVPLSAQSLKDALTTAKNYLLMRSWKSPRYIGHNPLQQFTYTAILLLIVGMVVTGFAMYALYDPRHWFFQWFMWPNNLIGNTNVRLLHVIGMWILLPFIPAHIYLSILADNVDREGCISSMISGGRWIRKGVRFVDEEKEQKRS